MMKKMLTVMVIVALVSASSLGALITSFNAHDEGIGNSDTAWFANTYPAEAVQQHYRMGPDADTGFGADRNLDGITDVSLQTVTSAGRSITKAYQFTGVFGDNNIQGYNTHGNDLNAAWEFWLKPAADTEGVIYEWGGAGKGMALWMTADNQINYAIQGSVVISSPISTTDFSQVVANFDGSTMELFINGSSVASASYSTGWEGGDNGGFGMRGGSSIIVAADEVGPYAGDIATFNFYDAALTPAEIQAAYGVYAGPEASAPSPGLGETVVAANPLALSWINADPNDPADDTYVDVWFGTEPNNMTQVVSGQAVETVNVDASTEATYYWRVDSYLYGEPGDGTGGTVDYSLPAEPNVAVGVLWIFNAVAAIDNPPFNVDAGSNIETWANNPTELYGFYEDDGVSPVTVTWTANDPNAVFSPSSDGGVTGNTINTTVTVDYAARNTTITLTVEDAQDSVSDSMNLDVWGDACVMTRNNDEGSVLGDTDNDCDVDLVDFANVAADWLLDYEFSSPVEL